MKKLFLILLALLAFSACQFSPPRQLIPVMEEEVIGLTDIPEENMPGYKHPEPRLECIAPCLFGLDHNPCCTPKKRVPPKTFSWTENPFEALRHADGERMILVLFRRSEDDSKQLMELLNDECALSELNKHYSGLVIEGDEYLYRLLRHTSAGTLKWLPDDFVMSPTLMFVKTYKLDVNGKEVVDGHPLPITFEGQVNVNMCNLLDGFYTSSYK